MSRARTHTKSEINDAAAAAAMHGVRVVMHPSGEIEFSPKRFDARKEKGITPEEEIARWMDGIETGRRA